MPLPAVPPSVPPEITELAWLLGARDTADAATPTREFWTAAGDVLWGVGFSSAGGGTRYEILKLERGKAGVRLVAQPDGGSPTAFPLVSSDGRSATFENPAHDDPQRIRYARKGRGLVASVGRIEDP